MPAMIARQGRPPRRGTRYRLRPGAYAVLVRGGRVLLTEQAMPSRLELQLPGGGIDPGEAVLPALAREVLEETGHRCGGLVRLGAYRRFTFMGEYGFHAEKLCAIYLGRVGTRIGPPREQGHRAVWMDGAEAVERLYNVPDRAWLARGLMAAGMRFGGRA
jgi:8-oxo-dGTP diphosphatase